MKPSVSTMIFAIVMGIVCSLVLTAVAAARRARDLDIGRAASRPDATFVFHRNRVHPRPQPDHQPAHPAIAHQQVRPKADDADREVIRAGLQQIGRAHG